MNLRITRASALVIGIALAGAAVATPQDHDSRPQARSTLDRNHDGAIVGLGFGLGGLFAGLVSSGRL